MVLLSVSAAGGRAASALGPPPASTALGGSPSMADVAAAGAGALPAGHAWTVTLVTGDVVGVRTVPGKPPLVTIRPGPGRRNVVFSSFTSTRGQIEVFPRDVAPLVGTLLDPALFDVTTLIQNGDDDARRSYLPLIVQGETGTDPRAAATAMSPALGPGPVLSSIDAVAAREPRVSAAQEGRALAAIASAAARAGAVTPRTSGGIRHIWLDRTVRADTAAVSGRAARALSGQLDHNLVQIGAPVAWHAGDTGRGIRVAVLDTGVDATHPDLRGQIAEEKNFSASPVVADRFGHGTFVAAQVAGTGAAADGERRGVAFGARLVIGKVLGDDGAGLDSSVIAGMQWAATQAKVISMSLGGDPSDGTDPVSEAVNRLTAADHVLFVIAAGNSGPTDETVAAPGAATDALTVGAVDAAGRLADFSSRGPRIGDYAIKPEITAPGVNIVSARAAGTTMGSPLDARYTTDSGTSMATPQVAGAAAVLAALHPRWSPAALKAALVSTAQPATGGDVYELGGGLLDLGAAVTDTVVAGQAVADLGSVPDGSVRPVSDRLSWTSTGKAATTIDLSAKLTDHSGRPVPSGVLGLTAGRLRIAAGGSASATLSLNPRPLSGHPGLYEGRVLARDGGRITRTPVSLYVPPPAHTLTLRATALPGTAAGKMSASAFVIDTSDPDLFQTYPSLGADGTATLRVPSGHYWVIGEVDDLTNSSAERSALTGQPEVTVAKDTTVTLDGAKAVPVTATVTAHPTQMVQGGVHVERVFAGQTWGADVYSFDPAVKVYAQPSGTASTGTFHAYTSFRLVTPAGAAVPTVYDLYHALGDRIPESLTYAVTPAGQAALARVSERFYALDGSTSSIGEDRYGLTATGFLAIQNESNVAGGSTRTDYLSTEAGIAWNQEVAPPFTLGGQNDSGQWVTEVPEFQHYAPGSRQTADWVREPLRPGPYSATQLSVSDCAPQPTSRSRGYIHVELVDLQNLPDGYDCLAGWVPWLTATSRTMRLYQNNQLIGESGFSFADFTVPAAAASYRLTYIDNTSAVLPVSTQTTTTWTFRSAAPAGLGAVRIPLLVVGYDLPLDLHNHPDGSTAVLSAAPVAGTPSSRITGLRAWTSTDNGRTWQAAAVRSLGGGRYSAALPHAAAGQTVSLRVSATDAAGSGIDQTIIAAYHG
jgi:subtilisin family serine protease